MDRTFCFATTCFLSSWDTLSKIGEFDTNFSPAYYEDVDYSIRARKKGVKLIVAKDAIAYHRANFSFSKVMKKREISDVCSKNRQYLINKHYKGIDRFTRIMLVKLLDSTIRPRLYDH